MLRPEPGQETRRKAEELQGDGDGGGGRIGDACEAGKGPEWLVHEQVTVKRVHSS